MIEICKDKQATRPLYEEIFDDSAEFVDYYYTEKCLDNTILVSREGGRLLAMLHLNPYSMSICGQTAKVYYVVAVATTASERHKGHMTQLFKAAFELMKSEHIPFCFLLPVDENIYSGLGFETITDFQTEYIADYDQIRQNYDIFCVHDETYLHRMEKESALNAADKGNSLPESPVIMAKITDLERFSELAGISFTEEREALGWLKSRRIYICEEV